MPGQRLPMRKIRDVLRLSADAQTDSDLAFGHAAGAEPKHVANLAHR